MAAIATTVQPTAIVGDADAAHRFFQVTWRLVTVMFAATAVALFAIAGGARAGVYVAVIAVALACFGTRPRALLRPIPSIATVAMTGVVVFAWLAN